MTSREQMTNTTNQTAIVQEIQGLRQHLAEDARAREQQRVTNINLLNQLAEVSKAQDVQQRAINEALASIQSALDEIKSQRYKEQDGQGEGEEDMESS